MTRQNRPSEQRLKRRAVLLALTATALLTLVFFLLVWAPTPPAPQATGYLLLELGEGAPLEGKEVSPQAVTPAPEAAPVAQPVNKSKESPKSSAAPQSQQAKPKALPTPASPSAATQEAAAPVAQPAVPEPSPQPKEAAQPPAQPTAQAQLAEAPAVQPPEPAPSQTAPVAVPGTAPAPGQVEEPTSSPEAAAAPAGLEPTPTEPGLQQPEPPAEAPSLKSAEVPAAKLPASAAAGVPAVPQTAPTPAQTPEAAPALEPPSSEAPTSSPAAVKTPQAAPVIAAPLPSPLQAPASPSPSSPLPPASTSATPTLAPAPVASTQPLAGGEPAPLPVPAAGPQAGTQQGGAIGPGEKPYKLERLRPLLVSVDNSAAAFPQWGLDWAVQVHEVPVEGGVTRLLVRYEGGEKGRIGPVRSARPYILRLAQAMGAVLLHVGGSPQALAMIERDRLITFDGLYDPLFHRSPSRRPPHNTYVEGPQVREQLNRLRLERKRTLTGKAYLPPENAASGERVEVRYAPDYVSAFRYDGQGYVWYRNGRLVRQSAPFRVTAVAVLRVSARVIDKEGRLALDLSKGHGALYIQGRRVPIVWRIKNGLLLEDTSGHPLDLTPYRTWFLWVPPWAKLR